MKPVRKSTTAAMSELIEQTRLVIPFDAPVASLCNGPCTGCSKKLLDFLDMELEDWESRLQQGEEPKLGDIQKLAKRCKKIYRVLEGNGLISDHLRSQTASGS
ncbi:hypothetical protein [Motiliproteus sp. MSK22-1]|uniref:hypothetical protein n=1 Tax=Motiliproteus sp. MSK22-1 TaxID=1897630 RepID=UPI000977BDED|nr:hypothetical protein [Motiliproteus sp. MSK22-1]OMH38068.1 hypothetical protein BGP75_07235 [Motiliproteus sp. MSK22-1]